MTGAPVLAVEALVKHFPLGHGRAVRAVNGISFQIERGEALALVGESGSGKTTVGRCVLRLIEPSEVADVVAFLLGPSGRAFTGAPVTLDLGWTAR